jgi:hypothetical protein
MAPDRSTTHAGTDRGRLRSVGVRAAAALAVLAAVVGCAHDAYDAQDADGGPPPVAAAPSPVAPMQVGDGRTVTALSLGGPATDPVLRRVEAELGSATERIEQFWGRDWAREIVVVATATDAEFAAAAPGAPAGMAAVAVADAVDSAAGTVDGQRIVLGPGASRMSPEALRIVLTHELFHYAARAGTATDAPRWITEGVADFVARSGPVPDLPAPTRLPSDDDFAATGAQLSTAYDRAWLFARFIADRYGEHGLRELYTAAAGPGHRSTEAALTEITGLRPADLLEQWRAWLAAQPRHR